MENYEKEFVNLLENLRSELDKERQEVLNIINIIHFYESMLLSFHLQVSSGEINMKNINLANGFAKKVQGEDLYQLYAKQNSVKAPDKDLFDMLDLQHKAISNEKLH